MQNIFRPIILFLLTVCVFTSPAFACDFDDIDGFDVGLVLSGGGAKSSTQVGVMSTSSGNPYKSNIPPRPQFYGSL